VGGTSKDLLAIVSPKSLSSAIKLKSPHDREEPDLAKRAQTLFGQLGGTSCLASNLYRNPVHFHRPWSIRLPSGEGGCHPPHAPLVIALSRCSAALQISVQSIR